MHPYYPDTFLVRYSDIHTYINKRTTFVSLKQVLPERMRKHALIRACLIKSTRPYL